MAQLEHVEGDDRITHLRLSGKLDIAGTNQIEQRFSVLTGARHRDTLVELADVSIITSIAIGMLIQAAQALGLHEKRMILVAPSPAVDRALRATAIDTVIPIAADLDEGRRLIGAE